MAKANPELIAAIANAAADLVPTIVGWVRDGLSSEEIQERLRSPDQVGRELLEQAAERQAIGRRLLGRDPK